jgi:sterol desaturase/sphingolipid hydroxylase (fatty acid hydroxylase superfamily)
VLHRVPLLWRIHRVHHSDTMFDTTTALRFHPFEIGLSMLYKMAVVVALGAPLFAVVLFEILLSVAALFNHSNVRLAVPIDRWLRLVIVTPDMHRVHHSVYRDETDSNFGFCLSFWDRLFLTYRPAPREGHLAMRIGLTALRDASAQSLGKLLAQPFLADR